MSIEGNQFLFLMRYKTIKVFVYFILSFSVVGCDPYRDDQNQTIEGYKPVYASAENLAITFDAPRALHQPGKIFIYGKYLLINDVGKGIHFINNADPSSPQPLGFLNVTGNVDLAVRNNILYVDHIGSLVALDISDLNMIKEISRVKTWSAALPPSDARYFECVDPNKGEIVGWELTTLHNPKCLR